MALQYVVTLRDLCPHCQRADVEVVEGKFFDAQPPKVGETVELGPGLFSECLEVSESRFAVKAHFSVPWDWESQEAICKSDKFPRMQYCKAFI